LAILFLSPAFVNAQVELSESVSGLVVSVEQIPIEASTVILMNAADSAIIKVELADKQGVFKFGGLKTGTYLISISSVGFTKSFSGPYLVTAGEGLKNIGKIVLTASSRTLQEVDVTAKERFVEVKPGKVILNVESSILSSGSTAFDILARSPGVQVDNSDNIKLNGKAGVLVMINGKQTFMEKENLVDLLKSTQSNTIESIELISNPSAKYAAAGIASIIDIRIKKNKNFGTNGVLTGMTGFSDMGQSYDPYLRYSGGLSLNHRTKILNVFGNYSHSDVSQSKRILSSRLIKSAERIFDVDYFSTQQRLTESYRMGADFNISPNHIIGALFNGSTNKIGIDKFNTSDIYNSGEIDSTIIAVSNQNRKLTNSVYNLNYKGVLGEKAGNLSIDLDYLSYNRTSLENLTNIFVDSWRIHYRDNLDLQNSSPSQYTIQSVKVDYSVPLNTSSTLDLGIQTSKVKGESQLDFGSVINSVFKPDAQFTNQFTINESIYAGFFSYTKDFKNSNLVVGLRAEATETKAISIKAGDPQNPKYLDLFPNVQYTQNLNPNHKVLLSYGRRIERPGYDALNPSVAYLDQYSFKSGNPLLKSAYTQNLELTHLYKDKISTTFRVSFVDDVFMDINEQNNETLVNTIITKNLDKQYTYGMELNAPFEVTKWWNLDLNVQANMVNYSTMSSVGQFNNSSPDVILTTLQSFSLGKIVKAEISSMYETPAVYGIYNFEAAYNVDAGLSMSLFKKQGSLKLRLTDLFNSSNNEYDSNFEDLDLRIFDKKESRTAQLSFSYSFGRKTIKSARKRSTGSETEQGRVGN
jgi:iron complex outermembrane recepter protein